MTEKGSFATHTQTCAPSVAHRDSFVDIIICDGTRRDTRRLANGRDLLCSIIVHEARRAETRRQLYIWFQCALNTVIFNSPCRDFDV